MDDDMIGNTSVQLILLLLDWRSRDQSVSSVLIPDLIELLSAGCE